MTRVLRIIDRLNIGGPAKHVVWLDVGLRDAGYQHALVTGRVAPDEGDMEYFARDAGVEFIEIPAMGRRLSHRDLFVAVKLLRLLYRFRPSIVHTHKSKAGAVGRTAAFLYRWSTPSALRLRPRACWIVHTYHGHTFHSYFGPFRSRVYLAIEKVLARFCTDRIIVISERQRQEICETFGVGRPDQYEVIPLGMDVDEAPPAPGKLRRELGAGEGELLVGIVGRLCAVKNHRLFFEVAKRLLDGGCRGALRLRFVVVGDGELRGELERVVDAFGLRDHVVFVGFRRDALLLYDDLDIVALTSLNEGTPLTLIEAMSRGRAVAATAVGGVADLMGPRRETCDGFDVWDHGVTAPRGDADGLAKALGHLIARPELRVAMGEGGRAFVRAKLSRERLVSDVERLYRNLLAG